jgi:hypothetical protein
MAMTETPVTLEGWEAPVYHAMQTTPTLGGIPMELCVVLVLSTCFLGWFWWPALFVGAGGYGVAWVGTQVEPRWVGILGQYLGYRPYYEG